MAALKANQPDEALAARAEPTPAAESTAEAAVRLAAEADAAVVSPARRLQSELEFNLADPDAAARPTHRWPPLATLLVAGVPSALAWWAIFVLGRAMLHGIGP